MVGGGGEGECKEVSQLDAMIESTGALGGGDGGVKELGRQDACLPVCQSMSLLPVYQSACCLLPAVVPVLPDSTKVTLQALQATTNPAQHNKTAKTPQSRPRLSQLSLPTSSQQPYVAHSPL